MRIWQIYLELANDSTECTGCTARLRPCSTPSPSGCCTRGPGRCCGRLPPSSGVLASDPCPPAPRHCNGRPASIPLSPRKTAHVGEGSTPLVMRTPTIEKKSQPHVHYTHFHTPFHQFFVYTAIPLTSNNPYP
ncbi:uncharacterized protein LOC124545401 [Schistocerca americana]|uniref:uncharacterized protein LOC124545401 n=1 Tax=Schistocerca americana TaxID=7009 RepID=UPI001F4F9E64|nr:uncharacterized protein LOC124545401 [Schistocerca americana]